MEHGERLRQALRRMQGSLQIDVDWVRRSLSSASDWFERQNVERYAGVLESSVYHEKALTLYFLL